ncbi:FeoA family protein [Sphingomonas baiyangensis]|uniref:Ferrous iron transport protein A n=1 Tax=Sphingomonas baiyangensis TaxID=2572576 RepID=A0A4U1L7X4_9SPHN|nr:FeoA family protein [Sphingomonas baiyangensis]TKD52864.1 ferrous iron transport protein A [Sphingomonas baiyangensis]
MLSPTFPLSRLAPEQRGTIESVDWAALSEPEAKRLREFGIDDGVAVEMVHRATLGGGPIACRIGRMTVALRRRVADAVHVVPA